MKIHKYLWGNSIEEWGSQWKDRLLPSARSRVLQKWNASGKRPKPESSNEYTKRRVKEETKRTWRSDAADILHGIGEGVLALHPYTAIPYYGAKVGQDVINGNVNLNTALNASIPLFHLSPQAVGLKEATNVALEDAANAGSKTARNWRVAREIKLGIKLNTKNGRIEVTEDYFNSPDKWYRITETPEKYGIMELGKNVTTHDAPLTQGTINGWRSSVLNAKVTKGAEGFIKKPPKIELNIRRKNGQAHGNTSQAAKGKLWGGTTSGSRLFPEGVIEGQAPSMINYGIDRTNFVITPWDLVPNGGRIGFHTGEMPMSNLGWFQRTNKGTYTYEPIIPEKRITYHPILLLEPSTPLKFFERKPIKINLEIKEPTSGREYIESPRDISSDVGNLIAEGSERSTYTSKSNPNIVYKIEDAPLDNIKNIKIRKEVADDIIAPETTVGYYNRNGKYYRVTLLDKYKSWNPDDFDINYSPELDLEIIDALQKAKWNVELGTYNGAPYARTASKNGIKIGNLEYFNWGRDPHGNLKLIDLYVYSLKQGGKMNTLLFLKNGSGIHIKKKNRGKFTDYCGGKVTSECIAKGKKSPNAAIRKRATFAANARKWKHKEGGKAFVNGVSILDSNPDAYKYVKKKYKMALEGAKLTFGLKVGNFLNSDLGQFAANAAGQFVNGIWQNKQLNKIKNELNQWKKSYINSITPEDYSLQVAAEEQQLMLENPDYNSSPIVQAYKNNILANNSLAAAKLKAEQEANQVIANYQLNNNLNWGNLLSLGLGLAGLYLSNKKLAT